MISAAVTQVLIWLFAIATACWLLMCMAALVADVVANWKAKHDR